MFSVIKKGKAGKWFSNCPDIYWKDLIRIEDSLTALVFDALASISGKNMMNILTHAVIPKDLNFQWLEKDDFVDFPWPFFLLQGTSREGVEPDRIIRCDTLKFILLIEAKLHSSPHEQGQLLREINAAKEKYPDYNIILLAVDGYNVHQIYKKMHSDLPLNVNLGITTWITLALSIKKILKTDILPAERRVLQLLLDGLRWFGVEIFEGFQWKLSTTWDGFEMNEAIKKYCIVNKKLKKQMFKQAIDFNDLIPMKLEKMDLYKWRLVYD